MTVRIIQILTIVLFFTSMAVMGEAIPAALPTRILREYALTSASAREKYSDPNNWQILGSNDGGQTWTVLDEQTNQVFRARSQRRVYHVGNQKAYNIYRLLVRGATTVQLAEWEMSGPFVGVKEAEAEVQVIASASKAHPLLGAAMNAFDHDPTSRWIDFGTGENTCWLQCQYSLEPNNTVTNVAEFAVAARRVAARNPLFEKAPQVLANYTNSANQVLRVLSGYALTSANDAASRDPRDWRLLGSNDRGATWRTLDARRNETFPQRYQRRFFSLTNEQPYAMYRLQIDCVRVPANLPGGASCIQLAEVEPVYSSKDPGGKWSLLVSAEGENPPIETLEAAFDGKARTKWLSFTDDDNTNRSSWIQWEYLPGGDPPILNLRWVKALLEQRPTPVRLNLEGVVVSWDEPSDLVGFLDETGFQQFRLQPTGQLALQPGDHIRLGGLLELGIEQPTISKAEVTRLQSAAPPEPLFPGQQLPRDKNFFAAIVEGRVTSVSDDASHWTTLGLASDRGQRMVAKIKQGTRPLRFFPGCHLKLEGIVQQLLDINSESEAGVLWVSSLDQVTPVVVTEKDWSEWPLYSLARLTRTNAALALGTPIKLFGRVARQDARGVVLEDKGTNQIRVRTESESLLTVGSVGEAVGFLDRQQGELTLSFAIARPTTEPKARTQPTEAADATAQQPVTKVRKAYERLEEHPGKAFPVVLRGVITYIDMEFDSFYMQDETDGIQVVNQLDAGLAPLVKQEGSMVEIHGQIDPDMQAVVPDGFVKILGKGRMPEARRHTWDYLITGKDDSRWIDIEGVVSDLGDVGLTLVVTGGRLAVVINEFDKHAQEGLLGSLVRISGVCMPMRDNRNRRIGVQLSVPFADCIEVLRPAAEHPFDMGTRKIPELLEQSSHSTNVTVRLTKTSGVVTYKEARLLYIQDGTDGMRVMTRAETTAQPGDRIEAVGFVEPDGFSPKLVQAIVRKTGREALPTPTPIDLMVPDVTDQDATRVQVEATLVGFKSGKTLQVLELNVDQGDKTFSAFVPVEAEALPAIPIGSRVRLTGVFRSETETMADLGLVPTSFGIYVSSPQEIVVLHRPSWWTAKHTLWVAACLSTILIIALTWATSLRKQVLQRTEQLRVEITEHKQTEEALATSDRFMRSLVESLPQNIVRKDKDGRFTFANEFFGKSIGKPTNQIIGKTDFDLFPTELATKFRNDDQQVLASGKPFETVELSVNATGDSIFVQVIKTPLLDAANQILGIQVIFWDVTERRRAEQRLEEAQKAMVDASRQAGMAEVAAGVLHNVGNVLNSVNVSANLVSDRLYKSKAGGLGKAVALMREHETDLGGFFESDPRGKQLLVYLEKLSDCLSAEQASAIQELQTLKKNIEHIKEIVAMQQSYAKIVGVTEKVKVTDLVEDALRLNSGTLARHEVELTRDYGSNLPEIIVERHKVLQILVNLIRNAKYACDESGRLEKRLVVRVSTGNDCVKIATLDNGVGIAPENITRIFNHGFTTRKDGHGFGLHSGALAAKEMGGTLEAQSEGVGKGACFTLSLPLVPRRS